MIRKFFSPPVFENDQDNFRAKFINSFVWVMIALLIVGIIPYLLGPAGDYTVAILSGLILVLLLSAYLLRNGRINASGLTIIILGWLGIGLQALTADGVQDVILIAYIALALLASIVISWRAGGVVILSSLAVIWSINYLQVAGYISPTLQASTAYARDLSLIFLAITAMIYFSTTSLREAIARASKSEARLIETNKALQDLNRSLEERVTSRTSELEKVNASNEKRAKQFEAIAQVASATTANENLELLLPRLASLISDHFGFYHTGIFLLDENREFAVLRAANSEGGKKMLERKHKLLIGQSGIVGYVSATGAPRIALDVGDDAAYFDNPDLPDTHSEMALPLRIMDQVMGVLDIQSKETNAFTEEDIEILSTLADQVAVALQNSRTYDALQELLAKAQRVSGEYVEESWQVLQAQDLALGYKTAGEDILPLDKPLESNAVNEAIELGKTVAKTGEQATLAIPIRLRDEVIGIMDIRTSDHYDWDDDEVDIAEAVADRLALALESSLLLKSTQRRAELERITAEISSKIGSSTQFESILRTAAEELSRVLGGSEVLVQIQSVESPNGHQGRES